MNGRPGAITRLASVAAFSSTRKPSSCDGAYGRTIIRRNATSSTDTATARVASGSVPSLNGIRENAANENAHNSTPSSTALGTPMTDGTRVGASNRRSTRPTPTGRRGP